jgi:tetratricopeptide (TPR) repeat protein
MRTLPRRDRPLMRTTVERTRNQLLVVGMILLADAAMLLATTAQQEPAGGPAGQGSVWYTLGRVTTLSGAPVRGAKGAVYLDGGPTAIQHFETSYDGEFEVSLRAELNKGHKVKLLAKREGYLDAVEIVDLRSDNRPDLLEMVLRESEEDPDQFPKESLISTVAQHVVAYPGSTAAGPGRNEIMRKAKGFLDAHDADAALEFLEKGLEQEPNCPEYRTLMALAMLQKGSWSGVVRVLSETAAMNNSLEPGKRRSEPGLVLGVLESWRGNSQRSTELFLQGLQLEPNCPLLLRELGRAYLLQQNWPGAEACFARAIQAGASPETHLLRAESLLAQARPADARTELYSYLGGRKPKELAIFDRLLWMKLNQRLQLEIESQAGGAKPVVKQSLAELEESVPELKGVEPTRSQDELPSILQKAGERVQAFFHDFRNTVSHEEIRQEILRRDGKVDSTLRQSFQYLQLTWPENSRPSLNEYRTEGRKANAPFDVREQDFMLTQGFASVSALLLPDYQGESTFLYLGRQPLDGRATYVLAFAQRPEVARLQAEFDAGGRGETFLSQGIVWVDSGTYQIIRMRTDMLYPLVKARLDRESTDIRFAEVGFPDVPLIFWLPRDVVVTVHWNGKLLRNQHSYSHFRLFKAQTRILAAPEPIAGP